PRGWIGSEPACVATGRASAAVYANCASTTGPGIASTTWRIAAGPSCCCVVARSKHKRKTSRELMRTGKTSEPAAASVPFRAADHLRSSAEIAAYIEAMLVDGDARAVPIALRTVADA